MKVLCDFGKLFRTRIVSMILAWNVIFLYVLIVLYISYFIISLSCTYSLVIFQFFVLLFWLDEIEVKKTILSLSELPALSVLQVIKLTGRKNKNAIPINFL